MIETKEERFKRLATTRTNKALHFIRLIENLAHQPARYAYTPEQVEAIAWALGGAIQQLRDAYQEKPKQPELFEFKL